MHCVFMETAFTVLFVAGLCEGNTNLVREDIFVDIPLNWNDAMLHCKANYTDLSSVLTNDDMVRLIKSNPSSNTDFTWIGLKRRTKKDGTKEPWMWSVGKPLTVENWAKYKPDPTNYNDCVSMKYGKWDNKLCYERHPFFCFKTYNRMLTVVQEMLPWENALDYCRSKYTDLSSLLSKYTAEQVINSTTGVTTDFVWTGLRFLMGRWYWLNEDPLYYLVWSNTAHSQCPALPLRCGALSVKDKIFEARSCEEELNFICYSELGL